MEETKENSCCKQSVFLHFWWIKSLIGFVVLLIVFCLGVSFGGHYNTFRSLRNGDGRANMFNRQWQNNDIAPGNYGCKGRVSDGTVNLNQFQTSTPVTNTVTK